MIWLSLAILIWECFWLLTQYFCVVILAQRPSTTH